VSVTDDFQKSVVKQVVTKTADYTVTLAERGQIFNMNKATAIALTLPSDSAAAIPIGSRVQAYQGGAGQLTFVAGASATVVSETGNLTTAAQYSLVTAEKVAANTWLLSGAGLTVTSNVIARDATELAVASSTAKNTVWSVAVPANKLGVDKTIAIEIGGSLSANSGTVTLTVSIAYGGTTMYEDATVTVTNAALSHPWFLNLRLSEHAGVTNSQVLTGHISMGSAAATTSGLGDIGIFGTTNTEISTPIYGTAAVDSTAAQNFVISFTMTVSNAANGWKRENAIAYMLGEGQKGDTGATGPTGASGTNGTNGTNGTGTGNVTSGTPQTGTTYTTASADVDHETLLTNAAAITVTVSSASMTGGQIAAYRQGGAGAVTFAPGSGVTLHGTSLTTRTQWSAVTLRCDSTGVFYLDGDCA
jgi:hypothetical protein